MQEVDGHMIVLGDAKIGGEVGISIYWCQNEDKKSPLRMILFEDHDGDKFVIWFDYGSTGIMDYKGKIDHKHWRGSEECDAYFGSLDMGDGPAAFMFKVYPGKKRFMFTLGEYINPKEFEADYIDYKKLLGKDIIGDKTYTDRYRM